MSMFADELRSAERRARFAPKEQPAVSRTEFAQLRSQLEAMHSRLAALERRPLAVSIVSDEPVKADKPKGLLIEDVIKAACELYSLDREGFMRGNKSVFVAKGRMIAMYLAHMHCQCSKPQIGSRFGGRDHTTVLNAVRRVADWLTEDEQVIGEIARLRRKLGIPESADEVPTEA